MTNNDIVQKLWNLCDVLRDDGINYSDYVTELVLLLFIKMVHENTEAGTLKKHPLPEGCAFVFCQLDACVVGKKPAGHEERWSRPLSAQRLAAEFAQQNVHHGRYITTERPRT